MAKKILTPTTDRLAARSFSSSHRRAQAFEDHARKLERKLGRLWSVVRKDNEMSLATRNMISDAEERHTALHHKLESASAMAEETAHEMLGLRAALGVAKARLERKTEEF